MPVTQEEIDAQAARVADLNRQIDDGVRQVTHGDESVTFNTTDSLMRARDDAARRLVKLQTQFAAEQASQTRIVYYHQLGRGYW